MAEETLYDSEAMRRFAGIELGDDRIPDETTILNFRQLLERHGLTEAIFADVNGHPPCQGFCRWVSEADDGLRRAERAAGLLECAVWAGGVRHQPSDPAR